MSRVVISDTSCLIVLSKINLLNILKEIFDEIWITEEIQLEFAEYLPDWIKVKKSEKSIVENILKLNIDKGEASAIALYFQLSDDGLLIIDERKGRMVATDLGIKIIGTIGIIKKAAELGIIKDLPKIIQDLKSTNFRISSSLEIELLKTLKN